MDTEVLLELEDKNEKVTLHFKEELKKIRTGRATPAMLDSVLVDFYGTPTPISQTSQISTPEPQQLVVKPYDKSQMGSVVAGINKADLGLNPQVEAEVIRLIIPSLTQEVRKDLVKKVQKVLEDHKVEIRNNRRSSMDKIKKSKDLSEDLVKGIEIDIQNETDKFIASLEKLAQEKEKDLMTI